MTNHEQTIRTALREIGVVVAEYHLELKRTRDAEETLKQLSAILDREAVTRAVYPEASNPMAARQEEAKAEQARIKMTEDPLYQPPK